MMNMKMTRPRLAKAFRICVDVGREEHRGQGAGAVVELAQQRRAEHDAGQDLADDRRLTDAPEEPAEQAREDDDEDDGDEDLGRAVGKRCRLARRPSRRLDQTILGSRDESARIGRKRGPNQARACQLRRLLVAGLSVG